MKKTRVQIILDATLALGLVFLTVYAFSTGVYNSSASNAAYNGVTKSLNDTVAPTAVTASLGKCGQIKLSWTGKKSGPSYNIYRNTSDLLPTVPFVTGIRTDSFVDYVPVAGDKYYYWIQTTEGNDTAVPAATNITAGIAAAKCSSSGLPAAPTGVTAHAFTCGEVTIRWSNQVKDESGYYVYRNQDGNIPNENDKIATRGINDRSYKDIVSDGTYHYWVSSFNAQGESRLEPAANIKNSGLRVISCQPNLSASDKDIIAINGKAQAATTCDQNRFEGLPQGTILKKDDVLTYAINICNIDGKTKAEQIIVTDSLENLDKPARGFNIKFNDTLLKAVQSDPQKGEYSYNASAGKLLINIGTVKKGVAGKITYDAVIKPSQSYQNSCPRCQNKAQISYYSNNQIQPIVSLDTPALFFSLNP